MSEAPLLLSFKTASELLGISRALLYQLHSDGRLGPMPYKLGRRSLLSRVELTAWVNEGMPPRIQWEKMNEKTSQGQAS
jgi:excisionase family DNA binding protein